MNEKLLRTWDAIQQSLKTMKHDSPRGLRDWRFYRPISKTNTSTSYELPITIDLAQRLFDIGIPAFAEVVYPRRQPDNGIQYCDVVIDLGDRQYFWIEVKLLWTEYLDKDEKPKCLPDCKTKETMDLFLYDCQNKLITLIHPEASFIGGLLVGFETSNKKIPPNHIGRLEKELKDWQVGHNPNGSIPIPAKPIKHMDCSIRIWFWYRSVIDS